MSAAYRHCVNGLLTSIVWTLTGRLYDVYITDIVYLLDVLVVIVYMSFCNCWDYLLLHEDCGVSVLRTGSGACRGGGGGGWIFKKCSWGSETHAKKIFFGGGGFWGVWGAPRHHPGVPRGRKTIHFFLWPWHVTGYNSGAVRLSGQKLSSRNLGGGRRKKKEKKNSEQNHKAFPAGSREWHKYTMSVMYTSSSLSINVHTILVSNPITQCLYAADIIYNMSNIVLCTRRSGVF